MKAKKVQYRKRERVGVSEGESGQEGGGKEERRGKRERRQSQRAKSAEWVTLLHQSGLLKSAVLGPVNYSSDHANVPI